MITNNTKTYVSYVINVYSIKSDYITHISKHENMDENNRVSQ